MESDDIRSADLLDVPADWEKEWKGMPEFKQERQGPIRTIIVHFYDEKAVEDFAAKVGQKIFPKQKYVNIPEQPIRRYADKRYVDESQVSNLHNL